MTGSYDNDDDSDDDLLPLSVLKPWLAKGNAAVSPLKSANKDRLARNAAQDESETRIQRRGQLSLSVSCASLQTPTTVTTPQTTIRRASKTAPERAIVVTRAFPSNNTDNTPTCPVLVAESSVEVQDSETESSQPAMSQHLIETPGLASRMFASQWTESPRATPSAPARSEKPLAMTHDDLAELLFPTQESSPTASPRTQNPFPRTSQSKKQRRITIISIPSDSEDENLPPTSSTRPPTSLGRGMPLSGKTDSSGLTEPAKPSTPHNIIDVDSDDSDYGEAAGVMIWNPPSHKSPKKLTTLTPRRPFLQPRIMLTASTHLTPSPLKPRAARDRSCSSSSDAEADVNTQRAIFQTPTANPSAKKFTTPAASATKASPNKRGAKTAFLKVRDDLAQQLIKELDEAVFEGRLPSDLKIVWNGRLNTTAGRASWKRNKETGGHDAEIELSVKVVDCEDKLKCTLSHEMCHIAAWAIDKEMKPAHGPAFKAWGRKIMKARKDITVTTKHSYDIAYNFQWQCTNATCTKIYGRHSASIDPAKHACGMCGGRLARLGKDGLPKADTTAVAGNLSARKESEWAAFSKTVFKRIKMENPGMGMIEINQLVAKEWQIKKAIRTQPAAPEEIESMLSALRL